MNYRILIALAVALIVGAQPSIGFAGEKLTLYKNPMCTCCEIYAQYMRDNGFDVVGASHEREIVVLGGDGLPPAPFANVGIANRRGQAHALRGSRAV